MSNLKMREQQRKDTQWINTNHQHYMMYINKLKDALINKQNTQWIDFTYQKRNYL